MNYAHIHLILNHMPVLGIGFGIVLMIYGFIRKSDEVKRVSLGVFVLAALITIPVYLTGEPAEEVVENLAGVSEAFIDPHQDWGFQSLILMEITGALALLNLIFFGHSFGKKFLLVTSLGSIIAAGSIFWTANLGGKIRHTEIRDGAAQSVNQEQPKKTENDDDDH
jgi:hypothetical protein